MDQIKLGKFISSLRKEKGITQQELADYLGVTNKAVSKWERGISCPDISLLNPISEYFGISTNELLLGEKIKGNLSKEKQEKANKNIIEYSKNEIDSNKRLQKNLKIAIAVISAIFLIIISIFIYRDNQIKNQQKELKEYTIHFEETLKSLKFTKDSPLRSPNWVLNIDDITYVVPDISYKDETKTTMYKELLSYSDYESFSGIIIYYNGSDISVYKYEKTDDGKSNLVMVNCKKNGKLTSKKYSKKEKAFYNENKEEIKTRIKDIIMMWNSIYK